MAKRKRRVEKQPMAKRFLERLMENRSEKMAYLFSALIILALALAMFPVQPAAGNLVGKLGEAVGHWLGSLFGYYAWLILLVLSALVVARTRGSNPQQLGLQLGAYLSLILAVILISGAFVLQSSLLGSCGVIVAGTARDWLGQSGMVICGLFLVALSLYLLRLEPWLVAQARRVWRATRKSGEELLAFSVRVRELSKRFFENMVVKPWREMRCRREAEAEVSRQKVADRMEEMEEAAQQGVADDVTERQSNEVSEPSSLTAVTASPPRALPKEKPAREKRAETADGNAAAATANQQKFKLPPFSLLDKPELVDLSEHDPAEEELLVDTLETFRVKASVVGRTLGPAVKRYELQPAPGTKTKSFTALRDELALALKATTVRVVAPIPGKAAVGIEVPRRNRQTVKFSGVINSNEFQQLENKGLNFAVGLDMGGQVVFGDLTRMPHLLVAGATNSGKSVCLHTILNSLLFTKRPDQLRLILIDPKRVELSSYKDIPHLIAPVIDDMRCAPAVLKWLVKEMDRRYREFAAANVRNLAQYNDNRQQGETLIPYIVVVVDEISDLMITAGREVEGTLARLSQMARGVGIHLVFATQNPVNDVVTGVIKANFPSRIAFKVANMVNSRTIIDVNGAEELLGEGDMLYCPADSPQPQRVMGCFLSKDEVKRTTKFWRDQSKPVYLAEITSAASGDGEGETSGDDPMSEEAIRVVLKTGQASTSMLQRRLSVGYSRAARLVDIMEREGIVGPPRGTKAREILVEAEEYLAGQEEDNQD